jgi:hypothetical protein
MGICPIRSFKKGYFSFMGMKMEEKLPCKNQGRIIRPIYFPNLSIALLFILFLRRDILVIDLRSKS